MNRARKRDENEGEIVQALRTVGAIVYLLDWTMDLLVWYCGAWYVIEVKTRNGRFRDSQVEMLRILPSGAVCVARTADDALRHIGAIS